MVLPPRPEFVKRRDGRLPFKRHSVTLGQVAETYVARIASPSAYPVKRPLPPSDRALWMAEEALQLVHLYAERGSPKFEAAA
jgi:hypothetical protein